MSQTESTTIERLPGSDDDPSAVPTWYGGVIFVILFLFTTFLLVFLADREQELVFDDSIRRESRTLNEVRKSQNTQLDEYTWTDRENNRVSVPLEQGRQEVLRRFGNSGER
ncbi:MAG: hypothetical protein AAEJ47_09230 [Planctomycetota bacterium]